MNYNEIVIGERIKAARCKPFNGSDGFSQSGLAIALGLDSTSRTTIRKWERGEVLPSLEYLLKMCELFGCELGYLLGEHELPTRATTDIQQQTGLSLKAIEHLQHHKFIIDGNQSPFPFEDAEQSTTFLQMLSMMIAHPNFFHFVCNLSKCGMLHNSGTASVITMDDEKSIFAGEIATALEKQGWSILSNIHAADYWLYSSLDTLRGIAKDIWEEPWIYGENHDK